MNRPSITYLLKASFQALLIVLLSPASFANCPTVTASFTTNQTIVCGPGATTITFNNTSTGAAAGNATTTYDWYLNGIQFDNTTGLTNPGNDNISAIGTYTYMMVATNTVSGCSDSATVIVRIVPVPTPSFTFNNNNACPGTTINFTNTSTNNVAGLTTYSWNFGDGTPTSSATNPSHVYAAGGSYNVVLTMTNGAGCSATFNQTVTVLPAPVTNISGDDGDGNTTNCLLPADPTTSETVVFTNTTTGAVSYLWNFGDGTPASTLQNPSHTYSSFGTYTVTMTATGPNGCTSTATITVVFEKYVSSSLTLDITEYSGCTPHTLTTLTNLSVNANTYVWNFGDGTPPVTTTSFTPPTHTYTTGGTYTITLTASNSCNTATATISPIIIVAGPTANFNPSTTLGCAPQNVTFGNTSTGTSPANNYQWNMGNGNTYNNTTTPPAQTYSTQGSYTVTLIAGNACGYDTVQRVIVIDSIPVMDLIVNPLVGCSPLTVTAQNNSSGNALSYAWYIDGIYYSGAAQIPNQTFTAPPGNTPQNHTITLTVSNHCGTRTETETIVVHPAVVANFNFNTDTICEGGNITFTDASFGDQLTWAWDFGNGNTASTQGPHTQTYNTAGTYPVQLIVNGFCGPDTLIRNIYVLPYPVADFTPSVTAGCQPLGVTFTNNSTAGATSYSWNFGAGAAPATSTLFNPPAVTYNTSGTSSVILTVNSFGCISTDTATITTSPNPVPVFSVNPATGCTPLAVTFNNTSAVTAGDTYNWNFGNGNTSTQQNPGGQTYVAASNDSIYTVTLTITTAASCVATATTTVTVHPLPVADFTPLPDTVCATTPVAFLNNSSGASSFSWNFGDGSPVNTQMSPSHSYNGQGTFTAQLIATTVFGCSDTVTHTILVDSIPTSNFNFTIECVGFATQFTDLSTGGITNWAWNFGDGNTSAAQNPSHLYATNGTYNVILTVTNPANCTHTLSQLVTVNAVPTAGITVNTTCLGQPTQFTDATTGVPVNWIWDFGDGTPVSNQQNPVHTYAATGTFTVTLISFGGAGCSDTVSTTVTVTPVPTANFTFTNVCTNDVMSFNSTSLGGPDTFFWNFGDGNTDNTNNPSPTHTYTTAGTYNVMLIAGYAASGCTDSITYAVTAFPRTVPNFTNNTPCLGAATNFTDATANTPITWNWDFGDASPADITQNPSHIYATPGFYTVELITSNVFGCVDTFSNTIQVFPLPVAGYAFDTVCANFASSFTDQSLFSTAWQWNFGDGSPVDNTQSPTHIFPAAGTYNVEQIVTNGVGCTDTITQTVTVNPNPAAAFTATVACHTYANNFTDNSVMAVNWIWDFGDGSPVDNNQNTSHIYPIDGTYTTTLIVGNVFGCTDTIQQPITVLPQPQSGFTNTTVCAGEVVQFNDTTTGGPNSWNWDFGDGTAVVTTQNPIHVFTTGGTYNITLISGNTAGCYDTTIVPVNVYTVPVPEFTNDTVCLFSINNFTDLSTDAVAINNWYWDFGDGNNSFVQNPTYIYQNAGTFNVTLLVTNVNGCDSSVTHQVIVNDIPVAAFTSDTVCTGTPTTFTDLSTGAPTQWLWNFGDGNTSTTGPVVTHVYPAPGNYIVTLFVSGGSGNCFDNTFAVAVVGNSVQAAITATDSACVFEPVSFTDNTIVTGGTIVSWTWDFGDGFFSNLQNPVHSYNVPGTYTVTLSALSDGGCLSTATQTILISPQPAAAFTVSSACENQSTLFTDQTVTNGLPISAYSWDFGDGGMDNVQNPVYLYSSAGNYNATLIVTNSAGCSDTVVNPVQVNPQPVAAFSSTIECLGFPTQFTDQSTISSGTINSWSWDFGDGTTSTQQNPPHVYTSQNDTFNVTLVVATAFGCVDTITQIATTKPIAVFNFGPDQANGCAPMTVQFSDNSTVTSGGAVVGWVWNFGDGTFSFQQNPIHSYPNAGSYNITLTVTTNTGCTYTDTLGFPITVYAQPIASFIADPMSTTIFEPEVVITDASHGGTLYEYDFGDMTYSNNPNPTHLYTAPGTYVITQIVTNGYGCSDTATVTIEIVEMSTFFAPNAITPNGDGVNDVFLTQGAGIVDFKLYVFNRWGELLFEADDINKSWDATYKGIAVKPDVYVWRVVINDINGELHEYFGHVTVVK